MLQWYNLIFELGFVALVLYAFVMGTGILGGVDDIHAEAHHDLSDGHHGGSSDHEPSSGFGLRGALGIGKVPLSVILILFLLFWSISGLVANHFLRKQIAGDQIWVLLSIVIALAVSTFGTGFFARKVGKYLPTNESYASSTEELVGKTAEVLHEVTETGGTARLHDQFGNLLDLDVRAQTGTGPFRRGQMVKVQSNLPGTRTFVVSGGQ